MRVPNRKDDKMIDEQPAAPANRELTAEIVASYVRRNQVTTAQLSTLISTIHQTLADLRKPVTEAAIERTPAVSVLRSVHRDYVVCLDCGHRAQMLRRHLMTTHGLSTEQYRARWNLKPDHPVTAPGYSERRSTMAKHVGFGRTREASAETTARPETETAATPQPKRRGRPRSAAASA
jgi:predicted transcriptional regulator